MFRNADSESIALFIKKNSKKIVITLLSVLFLVYLYTVIWSFSAQTGEESSSVSMKVAMFLTGDRDKAERIELPIRKTAHFSEYLAMGVFVFGIWFSWFSTWKVKLGEQLKAPFKRYFFYNVLWVFLSASADEIHQAFVPDRSPKFWDVLIDTSGGIFGLLCVCVFVRVVYLLICRIKRE